MNTRWRRRSLLVPALALLLAPGAIAQTGASPKSKAVLPKPAGGPELSSGVIVKSESIGEETTGGEGAKSYRLTINTAAVWRDWVRDQATKAPKTAREAAVEGNKSVATKGEPISPDTLVTVLVVPTTKVETRYRSATDEASRGAKLPEKAAEAAAKADSSGTPKEPPTDAAKAQPTVNFSLEELKPGLFVEVDYALNKEKQVASAIRVVRPVTGSGIPAEATKKD